jgi:hypothetical protein
VENEAYEPDLAQSQQRAMQALLEPPAIGIPAGTLLIWLVCKRFKA